MNATLGVATRGATTAGIGAMTGGHMTGDMTEGHTTGPTMIAATRLMGRHSPLSETVLYLKARLTSSNACRGHDRGYGRDPR